MQSTRPTVADIRALKGKRQISMLYVETPDEAAAANAAGIDMLSIIDPVWTPEMRAAAGSCFVQVGLLYGQLVTTEDYLRAAHRVTLIGGDACYCAAGLGTVRALADEGIPVVGHVGLIPSRCTWTGGFRAVGKEADSALMVYQQTKALEDAGAFGAELEVVPDRVAAEITKRTSLIMLGMGAGSRGRCAISVRRGCAGLYARAQTAPCQDLSRFRRRTCPAATGTGRCLRGIPRRCRLGRLSRARTYRAYRG